MSQSDVNKNITSLFSIMNIREVCRTCLTNNNNRKMYSLFLLVTFEDQEQALSDVLREFTSLKVSLFKPQNIYGNLPSTTCRFQIMTPFPPTYVKNAWNN